MALVLAAVVASLRCDHSTPSEAGSFGHLIFVDSGCSCLPPPYPSVTVYVDGSPYTLPLFGRIDIPLAPGSHTWSLTAGDQNPTTVHITAGRTVTVDLVSNNGCSDGCTDSNP